MPVPTYTRRRTARRENSEEIEDARPTQANGNDDDVSDEDQPRRTRVKTEKKGKGKQRAAEPEEEEGAQDVDMDAEDSDDEDRIDVANFPDQPLRQADAQRLKGIADDWDNMRNQINQRCDIYKDVAGAMTEAGEKDLETSESLQQLDEGIKEFIDVGKEMEAHSDAINALRQKILRGDQVANSLEQYEAEVRVRVDEYSGKTARQKYAKDERYLEFHSSIWEVRHSGDPMPPLTEFIPKADGDDSDSDDDLEIGGVTQNFNCPLSLTPLVNPVTSSVCGHSFSADSIKDYCKIPRVVYKCPAAGCNKKFKLSDCVPDERLAKKVKDHQRRQRAAAEDSDADEVID